MINQAAHSALSRIHLREMAVAAHYTGMSSDLQFLSSANVDVEEQAAAARRADLCASFGLAAGQQIKPFAFAGGVAIIPIHGTLLNRFSYSWSFVTGYNFIRQQVAAAGADPDVQAIVFDVNSYGGEAAGCFECSADIKRYANGKPTLAVVDSNCYSAAYGLACGTDRIVVTPSGGAGSIGVVAAHVSYEKMLDKAGIEVTFIHAGKHKVDGNPYEDLPDSVRADIQKSVNKSMDAFVAVVAKGRKMDDKAVRETEARMFRADDALSLGLIDAVASPSEAVRAFLGELSGSNPQPKKEDAMSVDTKPGDDKAAQTQQLQEAAKAERARVAGIQGCDEAKGRDELAKHLAFNTSMSVDDAKAILAASPKAQAAEDKPATGNGFKAAMDASKHPNVGADASANDNGEQSVAARVLATARNTGLRGYEPAKR